MKSFGQLLRAACRLFLPDGRYITPSLFAASLALAALQVFLLIFIWDWLLHMASAQGRTMRGGVGFGLTVYYGGRSLCLGFLIASPVAALTSRRAVGWAAIVSILILWSILILPALPSYPIRGTSFYLLGASLLLVGSGAIAPLLRKLLAATHNSSFS